MLVRFLSYAASVIGARRYKPLLVSCLAVILSITGITIVASSLTAPSKEQASGIGDPARQLPANQQAANDLGSLDKKQTKDNAATGSITPQTPSDGTDGEPATTPPSTPHPSNKPLEITVNSTTINLSSNSPNAAVTVSANNSAANLAWAITAENTVGSKPSAQIDPSKDSNTKGVIRFRAEDSPAGTYLFTVTVKDGTGQLSASKTITVVVN